MKSKPAPDSNYAELLPQSRTTKSLSFRKALAFAAILAATVFFLIDPAVRHPYSRPPRIDIDKVQQCSIANLKANLSFLDSAKPIKTEEFLDRQDRLAKALAHDGVDAFVLEPGYTFQ